MKLIKLFSFFVLFLIALYIIIRVCVYYLPYEYDNLAVDANNYTIAGPSLFENSDFESDVEFWDYPLEIIEGAGRLNSRGVIFSGMKDKESPNCLITDMVLEQNHVAFIFETWIRAEKIDKYITFYIQCINEDIQYDWMGCEIYGNLGSAYIEYSGSDLWNKVSFALELPKKTKDIHIRIENYSQIGNVYLDEINLYPATKLKR